MSSAALQNPPSSVPALSTSSLVTGSPSNRYNSASHPSPTQESYHAHSQQSGASPASSSSRRPSRRPSGNSAAQLNNDGSYSGHNSPMSSRAALTSPVPVTGASSDYQTVTDRERRRNHSSSNMPAAVPPRTSSTQHGGSSSAGGSSSRRAPTSDQRGTPRRTHDTTASEDQPSASQSSRSRRHHHAAQEPPERSSSNRDGRGTGSSTALPIRSQQPPPVSPPSGPSREASEILNSILVSPPEVDIERERQRQELAQPHHVPDLEDDDAAPPPVVATNSHGEEPRQAARSRHDHSRREKQTRFGEYILGNTIGEGEFGKVKLGWKPGGVQQVAIKLIKKDQLGSNPTRMAKIMREVSILRQLTHPNIVRLHKMEESERHYGIVLEYASGGELFDYILNHRYLKDNAARRLFAQLVSGVGYLHKKGIVHRDLKLENLLLDAHKNIIITDFGFANTFDPAEELSEDEELNLTDREFVKRLGLDKVKPNGMRKGDLMQTSCGSPCYAAPELVVSDSLYTGRKVDVWSCGVILYAMLAGYLPFDDDPANPEGDNINLLYKYIVNTPLTFPEYVTPHARDLLRRILVPNPRKRADLFEVARHSWLSEYAHVVELITSSTTTPSEIQNTSLNADDEGENHVPHRSNSVREAAKKATASPTVGGLTTKQGGIDQDEAAYVKAQKDAKRRTVQVEYVAPRTQTQRGEPSGSQPAAGKTRARSGSQGPVEVSSSSTDKPLPRDPPVAKPTVGARRPPSAHRNAAVAGPTRPNRDGARAISDNPYMTSVAGASGARPPTGGSMQSTRSARGSYSQPLPPEVADTNAHGRIQQPPRGTDRNYGMASPSQEQSMEYGRPSISVPQKFARVSGFAGEGPERPEGREGKGHKRSNTIGEISGKLFGRSGSLFGGRNKGKRSDQPVQGQEKQKRYPPVSMNYSMPGGDEPQGRPSVDSKRSSSRRSFSQALGRKRSGSVSGSQTSHEKQQNRRFSFIPGFSLKAIGIGKDDGQALQQAADSQQDLPIQEPPQVDQYGRYVDPRADRSVGNASTVEGMYAQLQDPTEAETRYNQQQQHQRPAQQDYAGRPSGAYNSHGAVLNTESESSIDNAAVRRAPGSAPHPQQQQYYDQQQQQPQQAYDQRRIASTGRPTGKGAVLQKNKRFVDAWDTDESGRQHDHSGSSGPARKVMDFFRRRGKARGGE
ncbi:hypothetical protein CONLIGDRAFT_117835 [Coniochaeta ligniaria NRRL 30616]|uniref:non-specific serine/threonine protein kinase n=1 Tax=Coniochaeta ligniaria NRRL 30616 TaxID=1408157 RepID=A0A1J7I9E4_9PEZI|nr:hypothetical protein CONLIGDRAFT_117835 [Coniochaeta ligniaria NRRL 30616]